MTTRVAVLALVTSVGIGGVACELPPMETTQGNFRGLAVEQVTNPRLADAKRAANQIPDPIPPVPPGSPLSKNVHQNVPVLGHLGLSEFTRLMAAMTFWVAPPDRGCNHCHAGGNLVSDELYTKVVSRRMIQMTMDINQNWKDHVGETGVTCYTCHRGQEIPAAVWSRMPDETTGLVGDRAGQNAPVHTVGLTSLPSDPFSPFLSGDSSIRIQSPTALPVDNRSSIKQAEWTYAFMVSISNSLGVNCTYCHNSRAFKPWESSAPARVTAWHAIQMVRHLNNEYLSPLEEVLPVERKGPLGDALKVNCETCHRGVNKPLYGVSMLKDYPELAGPGDAVATD